MKNILLHLPLTVGSWVILALPDQLTDTSALALWSSAPDGTADSLPTLREEHGATRLSLQRGDSAQPSWDILMACRLRG